MIKLYVDKAKFNNLKTIYVQGLKSKPSVRVHEYSDIFMEYLNSNFRSDTDVSNWINVSKKQKGRREKIHNVHKTIIKSIADNKFSLVKFLTWLNMFIYLIYDESFMTDLLVEPIEKIRNKYMFVNKYIQEVEKTNRNYRGKYLINDVIDALNLCIDLVINYEYTKKYQSEIIDALNIRVCPYCNAQYIPYYEYNNKKYRTSELDHVLPKSIYPLFSMSLMNLIPSCSACNGMKNSSVKPILNPYFNGFGDDCYLRVIPNDVNGMYGYSKKFRLKWTTVDSSNNKDKINNNIDVFRLNEIYEFHKPIFAKILRIKQDVLNNKNKYIQQIIPCIENEELLYGTSFKEENFQNEQFAKAIYDIVNKN